MSSMGELMAWVDLRDDKDRYLGRVNYAMATVEIRHRGQDIVFPLDIERIAAKAAQVVDKTPEM